MAHPPSARPLAQFIASVLILTMVASLATAAEAESTEPQTAPGTASVATTAAACPCKETKPPVYVADWDRLAELTRSDPRIYPDAAFYARRENAMQWLSVGGVVLGGGPALLGVLNRLNTGSWTEGSQWSVAGGVTVAAFSLLAAWAYSPTRDDLLTVINYWNLRHPDRVLAP